MRRDSYRSQLLEDYELGWRAAGSIARECEGPSWMRLHIISYRFGAPNELNEDARSLSERPKHQMM